MGRDSVSQLSKREWEPTAWSSMKASEAHQVSFEDGRELLKTGILSNRFIKVSLN